MDKTMMINAMKDSISKVLEQMFFLPIDFMDTQSSPENKSAVEQSSVATTVGFEGSPSGVFRLTMPKALAATVTADFLGVQPISLTEEQVTGTVKEMLNMLAGNTLSSYSPEAVFDLQIPELITPTALNEAANRSTLDISIQTLESRMALQLLVE